jgi:hypothetical protein
VDEDGEAVLTLTSSAIHGLDSLHYTHRIPHPGTTTSKKKVKRMVPW